jgi:NTP pyrophosphatase (non-canonical NTP hydrolase)
MEFADYQAKAEASNELHDENPEKALNAALFGLGSETGSLMDIRKKLLTGDLGIDVAREELKQELGDLLWYVSRVATAIDLNLETIASENLERAGRMWRHSAAELRELPELDNGVPGERFPRHIRFLFEESELEENGKTIKRADITLVEANHNDYPDGPVPVLGPAGEPLFDANGNPKTRGYEVGAKLGAQLDDNSKRVNGYRYHDAIHMAFMTMLHWSPTMRSLMNIKRKSQPEKDAYEESARPIFLEEGLAAVLAALAPRRLQFGTFASIDGDVLTAVNACTKNLESSEVPDWAWRHTIVAAFGVMGDLEAHGGGYVVADLEARMLTFEQKH